MRDHQLREPRRSDVLAWSGTVVLLFVGLGLVAVWLLARAVAPATTRDGLDDLLQGAVALGGLVCVLAVAVGARMLSGHPLSAGSHGVRRDPARHGAHARSTVSASLAGSPRPTVPESGLRPSGRARHL